MNSSDDKMLFFSFFSQKIGSDNLYLFELEFYSLVNTVKVMSSQKTINLLTLFLAGLVLYPVNL